MNWYADCQPLPQHVSQMLIDDHQAQIENQCNLCTSIVVCTRLQEDHLVVEIPIL